MTGDHSQIRFDKRNRYAKVIHQQGRVFSDADFVEAAYIAAYFEETERVDVIGSNGAPVHDAGFLVVDPAGAQANNVAWADLSLSAGRYYVRGKLAEIILDGAGAAQPKLSECLEPGTEQPPAGTYITALEVYERYVAPVEEREQMLDDALRGVDTTGRTRMEWRIRLEPCPTCEDCADVAEDWPGDRQLPTLIADAPAADENTDPCDAPNLGGYQGLENQLYRVEVYLAGAKPEITWARDNASVLAEVNTAVDNADGSGTIELFTLGRDAKIGIQQGEVLEVLTRSDLQHGLRGTLIKNFTLPEGESEIVVDKSEWTSDLRDAAKTGFIRRWHGHSEVQSNQQVFLEPDRKDIFITIDNVALLRAGDYWCIPTRTLSGMVLWPTDDTGKKIGRPPFGTTISTAVIGILKSDGANWTLVSDCRNIFYPLTEQTRLLYVGGDGQEAMPGDEVPWPLEVGVVNGVVPVKGAKVSWSIEGEGSFVGFAGGVLQTGADGLSSVRVKLGPKHPSYTEVNKDPIDKALLTARVTAVLLDEHEVVVDVPVHFNLNKSIARNVAYLPDKGCVNLAKSATVQMAISRLAQLRRMVMDGGDTQVILRDPKKPKQALPLPHPLVVRLFSGCGPAFKAVVTFKAEGGLVADPKDMSFKPSVDVVADEQGRASCRWQPDLAIDVEKQGVIATYKAGDYDGAEGPWTTRFVCQALQAKDIAFDPETTCTILKKSETVQEAIDTLCANLGKIPERFYNLTKLVVGPNQDEVKLGGKVDVSSFFEGLTFIFNEKVELSDDVFNRGTVIVEAEVVAGTILDNFGAGTRLRLVLLERQASQFAPGSATWFCADTMLPTFIEQAVKAKDPGLMIRVTLHGDYLPAKMGDGIGYLRNATSSIERKWKVIDETGGPGGDVHLWFWLVKRQTGPSTTIKITQLAGSGRLTAKRLTLSYSIAFSGDIPEPGAVVTYSILSASGQPTALAPQTVTHPAGGPTVQDRLIFVIPPGTAMPTGPLILNADLQGSNSRKTELDIQTEPVDPIGLTVDVLDVVPARSVKFRINGTFPTEIPAGQVKEVPFTATLGNPPTTKEFVAKFTGDGSRKASAEAAIALRGSGLTALTGLPATGWVLAADFDGTPVKGGL